MREGQGGVRRGEGGVARMGGKEGWQGRVGKEGWKKVERSARGGDKEGETYARS